ncbi:MAG TPA: transposase [Thermoguttaceae bacterium]|nr:transposase [Thermoguttaceae bacterium]
MPRTARVAPGGMLFHVLNRGVGRMQIFRAEKDYDAFHRVVEHTLRVAPIRICAYCWMPNHWHFVLWPARGGDLSRFMQRMANMHTQRWQRAKRRVGYGHLYQGRFKSFPLENDEHFYSVVRYVERNALRAGLVARAEDWKWGSLYHRARKMRGPLLGDWPLPQPSDWTEYVNVPQTEAELESIRRCLRRGSPYGEEAWIEQTADQLGLQSTLRPRGRPHKPPL